jgi:tellurite resistance protein TerC
MMRRLKAIITSLVGFTVLLVGVAMLVLPGPGLVVIAFGLVILSAEFVWARRALDRMKEQGRKVRDRWGPSGPATPPPL